MLLTLLSTLGAGAGFQTYDEAVSASVSVSESLSSSAQYEQSLTVPVSLGESSTASAVVSVEVAEAVTSTTAFSSTVLFAADLSEGVSLAEAYANSCGFNATLAAQLTLADQLLGGIGYYDTLTVPVALSDGAVVNTILADSLGEAIAAASSLGATQVQVASLGATLLLTATYANALIRVVWPNPTDVRLGVQYGPTGEDYTGTASFGTGQLAFASTMYVIPATDNLIVTLTENTQSVVEKPRQQEPVVLQQTADKVTLSRENEVAVCTARQSIQVRRTLDEVWVLTNREVV